MDFKKIIKNPIVLVGGVGILIFVIIKGGNNKNEEIIIKNPEIGNNTGAFSSEDVSYINDNIVDLADYVTGEIKEQYANIEEIQKQIDVIEDNIVPNETTVITDPVKKIVKPVVKPVLKPVVKKPVVKKPVVKPVVKNYQVVGTWGKDPISITTLSGIAKKHKTSVDKLLQLNPNITNRNLIYPNQKVRVS